MEKIHEFTIPIRTVSEANTSAHWSIAAKRRKKQAKAVRLYMNGRPAAAPCVVKLTRIAPRKLDSDNNTMALKAIRDAIADNVNPGLAPGRADDDKYGIHFVYFQEKGAPKTYAVRVEIFVD